MGILVQSMAGSKKFLASAMASVLSYLAIRDGMTVEQILLITGPLMVYVGAQGMADFGKAKNGSTTPPQS
jgi:hypothetical protein